MRINLLGRRWYLRFGRNLFRRGDCEKPTRRRKEIRIDSRLRGKEKLEVLMQEMIHAAGLKLDEAIVEQFGREAARVLWRLGYRETRLRGRGKNG